ncbi:MAG: ATPase [Planctomycetaceae bacterium]|nr:ATPase [Planctomycetaceae bacterium]
MSFGTDENQSVSGSDSPAHDVPLGDTVEVSDELYEKILRQVQDLHESVSAELKGESLVEGSRSDSGNDPIAPASLEESGLSLGLIADLAVKLLYLNGTLTGFEIARHLKLPFSVLQPSLDFLKSERCLDVPSGEMVGPLSYRYHLTEYGRTRAREAFDDCRYVGPAPVSLSSYEAICRRQAPRGLQLSESALTDSLKGLVVDRSLLQRLGPALCGGQAIYLYGPPGSGKTVLARALGRMFHEAGGEISLPYAVAVDHQIIALFDPSIHRPAAIEQPQDHAHDHELSTSSLIRSDDERDLRWRKVRRPVVIVGGELTLEMLELKFHESSGYYSAPLHMKANGGIFLIDDFGRQLVAPQRLLNRWILPLEERTDYLTLATGKKFAIPFEQLTLFSSNLSPHQLSDDAFLRRIRHKIGITPPTEKQYREIFKAECERRAMKYDDWLVTRLLSQCYNPQISPKRSDPRDLLEVLDSICRFRGVKPHLSEKILFEAYGECLGTPPGAEE